MKLDTVVVEVGTVKARWGKPYWKVYCTNRECYLLRDVSLLSKLQEGFRVQLELSDDYSPLCIVGVTLLPSVRVSKEELDDFMKLLSEGR